MADIVSKMTGMNKTEKSLYLKSLTAEETLKYKRYRNNLNQKKYKEANKEKANERSKIIMMRNRKEEPDKYKELNKKHNKDFNERKKALLKEKKANDTLTNAIKTRNAKREMLKRALEKANETIKKMEQNKIKTNELIKEGRTRTQTALLKIKK